MQSLTGEWQKQTGYNAGDGGNGKLVIEKGGGQTDTRWVSAYRPGMRRRVRWDREEGREREGRRAVAQPRHRARTREKKSEPWTLSEDGHGWD